MAAIVCLHAHPDDEVLLTGGTIAQLAAEGHRVVVVVGCDGIMGPAEESSQRPSRLDELRASARVLGAARAFWLLASMPAPVFGLLLGTEWYAEPGSPPGTGLRRHVLD